MNIGMTYDLRDDYLAAGYSEEATAEFDRPDTIAAIEDALRGMGHEVDRIGHVKNLVARLAAGDRWDLVFNIAEGLYGAGREAQVPALLEAYEVPCVFSDSLVLALTLHKGLTKRVIRDLGLPTADFAVVETVGDVANVELPYPLFCKPVAEGTGKGISAASKVGNPSELAGVCRRLLAEFRQPVLVETYLPGREFTVGIVGTGDAAECVGVMEIILNDRAEAAAYGYVNKEHYEELVRYEMVHGAMEQSAASLALACWRGLGCRDGGRIDLRADAAGRLCFMEVNPLAGLHPVRSDLPILAGRNGISYRELLRRMLDSAILRVGRGAAAATSMGARACA
ncbi:MAG: D-alanine--D-alanine ligase [Planctomycetes bacterium]|nr:D-alanine--D-alanine ligase [Planctomycetota bacterium]